MWSKPILVHVMASRSPIRPSTTQVPPSAIGRLYLGSFKKCLPTRSVGYERILEKAICRRWAKYGSNHVDESAQGGGDLPVAWIM